MSGQVQEIFNRAIAATITWVGAVTATATGDTYEILDTVIVGNHTLGTYIKIPCIMATFAAGTLLALA